MTDNATTLPAQYRRMDFNASSYDAEAGTLTVEFSSETRVQRGFGAEILSHDTSAADFGLLRNQGPVMWEHDEWIGNVTDARIENKRGVADIKLGVAGRAAELRANIAAGVKPKVSVGYRILKVRRGDDDDIIATRWQPFEVSLVGVGADSSARVRSESLAPNAIEFFKDEGQKMSEESKTETRAASKEIAPVKEPEQKINVVEIRSTAANEVMEMIALGDQWGKRAEAEQFVKKGKSLDDFRSLLLDQLNVDSKPVPVVKHGQIDLSERDQRSYSLCRALSAMIDGNWKDAGLELEVSQAIAQRAGKSPRGVFMPISLYRAPPMGTDKTAEGLELVGTSHRDDMFVEHLYNNSVVMQAGAMALSGLVSNVNIPRQTGSAAQSWVDQQTGATPVSLPTGTIALSPNIVTGAVSMSRLLIKQALPSVEAMVRNDLARGAALAIDLAALEGTGAGGQPTGMTLTSGVGTQTVVGAAPTFVEAVGFETTLGTANALMGSLAYITKSSVVGTLKTTAKDAGSGQFVMQNGEINGYPVFVTNQMAGKIFFGNWNDIIIADWGVIDIQVDTATLAAAGGVVLRSFMDVDIGIRHAASFVIDN